MKRVVSVILALLVLGGPAVRAGSAQDGTDVEDISLESLLDAPVNAAARHEQTAREAPASVTVITAEEIERCGCRTLSDVLALVQGVYLNDDRDYVALGVRGFGRPADYNNRIRLLLNGHTLNEVTSGIVHIDEKLGLDLDLVERIEVVRGPGSALYGTGAMLAVINVVTKGTQTLEPFHVAAAVGSHGRKEGRVRLSGRGREDFSFVLSGLLGQADGPDLYFKEFDTPRTNHGRAEDLDWEQYAGAMVLARYGRLRAIGSAVTRRGGTPTAVYSRVFNHEDGAQGMDRMSLALQYDHTPGPGKYITGRADLSHYAYNNAYPFTVNPFTFEVHQEGVVYKDRAASVAFGLEGQFRLDTSPRNRFTLGLEYRNAPYVTYRFHDDRATYLKYDLSYYVVSAFVQDEYNLTHDLVATVGVRYDRYSTTDRARRGSASCIIPRGPVR